MILLIVLLHALDFQLTQGQIGKSTPTIDKILVWWYIIGNPAWLCLAVNVTRFGPVDFCASTNGICT